MSETWYIDADFLLPEPPTMERIEELLEATEHLAGVIAGGPEHYTLGFSLAVDATTGWDAANHAWRVFEDEIEHLLTSAKLTSLRVLDEATRKRENGTA